MKNLLIASLIILGLGVSVKAEPITVTDLSNPLLNARVGIAWDLHGKQYTLAQVPLIQLIGTTSKLEYANFSMGAVNKMPNGKVGYTVGIGGRIDNLFTKAGDTDFAKKNLLFTSLPPVMISTTFVTQDFKSYIFLLGLSTKFGR